MRGPTLALMTAITPAAFVAAITGAFAQSVTLERIDIVDAGIYRIETGAPTAEANTPTGEVTAVSAAKLIEATRTVPARAGTEFGFRYIPVGDPQGAEVPLDIVITYPEGGLSDPASGKTLAESRYSQVKKTGATEYLGYGFEQEWEAMPGTWRFEIWHDGKRLADETFTVAR